MSASPVAAVYEGRKKTVAPMCDAHQAPLPLQKTTPLLRQLGSFDVAPDPSLELGMKDRRCSVNHYDVCAAFRADGVRHSRRNDDTDIVRAAMIVAIDEQPHR